MRKKIVALKPRGTKLFVPTPKGKRYHGTIKGKIFERMVSMENDLMHIFDAWAIHPEALKEIVLAGVKKVRYICSETGDTYETTPSIFLHKGIRKSRFRGGDTIYLKRQHFNIIRSRV